LNSARTDYEELRRQFDAERSQLSANARQYQLNDHLKRCLIADADIPGIGQKRNRMLIGRGVETAFDVIQLSAGAIEGFGDHYISLLSAWRQEMVASFRFDSSKATPPSELRSLHMQFHVRRVALQRELSGGEETLEEIRAGGTPAQRADKPFGRSLCSPCSSRGGYESNVVLTPHSQLDAKDYSYKEGCGIWRGNGKPQHSTTSFVTVHRR
jgi:hypothetical protein